MTAALKGVLCPLDKPACRQLISSQLLPRPAASKQAQKTLAQDTDLNQTSRGSGPVYFSSSFQYFLHSWLSSTRVLGVTLCGREGTSGTCCTFCPLLHRHVRLKGLW